MMDTIKLNKPEDIIPAVERGRSFVMYSREGCMHCGTTQIMLYRKRISGFCKKNNITPYKFDVGSHEDFAQEKDIRGVPYFEAYVDGTNVGNRQGGFTNETDFESQLVEWYLLH